LRPAQPDQEEGKQATQYDVDHDAWRNGKSCTELHRAEHYQQ
jgi:hypothetical protein